MDSKTILELKIEIAKHYNQTYKGFNILNRNDIIDSSRNNVALSDCQIKRMVRLAESYNPGNFKKKIL